MSTETAWKPRLPEPSAPLGGGRVWSFGDLLLEERERRLTRDGVPVPVTPKALGLLLQLVSLHGRLVTRSELMAVHWPDTVVEDATLDRQVSTLRKALGSREMIETVPKAGYRFVEPVREVGVEPVAEIAGAPATAPDSSAVEAPRVAPGGGAGRDGGRAVVLTLAALAVLAVVYFVARSGRERVEDPRSVAVLPFASLSAVPSDEFLGVGLADTVITHLSQVAELEVRSSGAVRRYAEVRVDPLEAGRELAVDAVLEGTVRRFDGQVRVSARLLRVADGRSLFSATIDRPDHDLFSIEDELARETLAALSPALRPAAFAASRSPRGSGGPAAVAAHELYLRGRFFWGKRTEAGHRRAVELFEEARALDPGSAEVEAGLAAAWALLAGMSEPTGAYLEARRHADRALELDPTSADARAVLGLVAMNYDADWARAEREYRAALALQPNHPTVHHWYGEMLAVQGRPEEGLPLLERAQRLDPLSLAIASDLAKSLYWAGRYDQALAQGERVLEMDPGFASVHAWMGLAALAGGDAARALDLLVRFDELDRSDFSAALRIFGLQEAGQGEEASSRLLELEHVAQERWVTKLALVAGRFGVGDDEGALAALAAHVAEHGNLTGVYTAPSYQRLRADPRFGRLTSGAADPVANSIR